jgi:hypothetical protein
MYASLHKDHTELARVLRTTAAVWGAAVMVYWLVLVAGEMIRLHTLIPNPGANPQILAVAAIFASYLIGWKHELLSAALALAGVAALLFLQLVEMRVVATPLVVCLAAPAVLYVAAWWLAHRAGVSLHPPKSGT